MGSVYLSIAMLSLAAAPLLSQPSEKLTVADQWKQGHSHQGDAFDIGPRTKPVKMNDIGYAHFPITTKNPEVQMWFDQGITLLHSFWDYEAERSFRWCLKLEPDNAMAYWGLARAAADSDRSREFLAEAVKRKEKVTDRERLYIEALEALDKIDSLRDRGPTYRQRNEDYRLVLETLCVKYPDDMEAKALLALATMGESRYGTEQMVREILAVQPNHPGAHHYRIHNWNQHEPEQALVSCKRYSEIAPGIGHAQHMPGHIYATVGMWNEAAISMDAATRTEIRRMHEQLVFPFNYWNYGHNRNYLSYIQEQLGMADAAMTGAKQLVEAPLDPKFNADGMYSSQTQGLRAMQRNMIRFERWDDLLAKDSIPWRDIYHDNMMKTYGETRAWIAKGERFKAEKSLAAHGELGKEIDKNKDLEEIYKIQEQELKGRVAILRGETLLGLGLLSQAAEEQYEEQHYDNDPPHYPQYLYPELGRAYLTAQSPQLAIKAYEKALIRVRNDLFSLAGLVEAYHALGQDDQARKYLARLLYVTANADKGLAVIERAKATGLTATPTDSSPEQQRNYATFTLAKYGPALWNPYAAPSLNAVDQEKKRVTLEDYRGKNVILVFYLGRECLHCMKQLQDIAAKSKDWEQLDTVVLAVSPNKPEDNAEYLKTLSLPGVRVLSDEGAANARRFQSYDDFEEMEVHSTILIDKQGRVHWASKGGEPFGDMAFLSKQLERMNKPAVLRASN